MLSESLLVQSEPGPVTIASQLLALILKDKEQRIRDALDSNDLGTARKLVNGGHHGLKEFSDAYNAGRQILPEA